MKRRWIFLLAALVILILMLGCQVQVSNDYSGYSYYYSGRVTSASGEGIGGVTINFNNTPADTTDFNGNWSKGFNGGGGLTVRPQRRGFIFDPSSYYISNTDHSENYLNFTVTGFTDDFTYNDTGWPLGGDLDGQRQYFNNEYQIVINTNGIILSSLAPVCMGPDYTVQARVRFLSGDGYCGLIFNWTDWNDYNVFQINPNTQYYRMVRVSGGVRTTLNDSFSAAIIAGTSNLLKVEQNGGQVFLSINGIPVGVYSVYTYGINYLSAGVQAWRNSSSVTDVRFDDFELYSAVLNDFSMLKASLKGAASIHKDTE